MAAPLVIRVPGEMSAWSDAVRGRGDRLAFVPTMGALHEGHTSLMVEGKQRARHLVVSVFLNPIQFGPGEDLAKYPRDLAGDLVRAEAAGADVAFVPEAANMYPVGFQTTIEVRDLQTGLCGGRRPGHFLGVATVVCKLFNIVRPHLALFGEKDFQQLVVIRRLVRDLDIPVEIVGMPIVREPDGLARSSRNVYLSREERARALSLMRALDAARLRFDAGERDAAILRRAAREVLAAELALDKGLDRGDYVELRDAETLAPLGVLDRPAVLALAVYVGSTRLIDNVRLG